MTKIDLQYDLVNYTPATASTVDANFDRLEQHVNQEVIERDGTVAMRQPLKLAGDPVAPLDAATKQYVDAILPVGIIMPYGGTVVPPGGRWEVCDGSQRQTSEYPELFQVLGYVYGGSGGFFNLPPSGRMPVGATDVAPALPHGSTGGSRELILPKHKHTMAHKHPNTVSGNDTVNHSHAGVDHLHRVSGWAGGQSQNHVHGPGTTGQFMTVTINPSGIVGSGGAQLAQVVFNDYTAGANVDHQHYVDIWSAPADRGLQTSGVSAWHQHYTDIPQFNGDTGEFGVDVPTNSNMPPYFVVTFIIRTK